MQIDALVPDRAAQSPARSAIPSQAGAFAELVDRAQNALLKADVAEAAFARGTGGLQEMVVERARADITLAVATTGVQRTAQALNTLLGMQI